MPDLSVASGIIWPLSHSAGGFLSFDIQHQVSLAARNSLGVEAWAEHLVDVTSEAQLAEVLAYARQQRWPVTILGGGSNSVFARDMAGLVVCQRSRGIQVDGNRVTVAAGESWHELVLRTLELGLFGLENLTLIPGQVGAAPIQNIGAYGVEVASLVASVRAIEMSTGAPLTLSRSDCQFGYRDSIFKHALRQQVVITEVTLDLQTSFSPQLDFVDLQRWLASQSASDLTGTAVSQAVASIRRQKLPDPGTWGNVGSFFKNPVVAVAKVAELQGVYADMPARRQADGQWKLSAAWLIEQAGLKGLTQGKAQVSTQHCLVLINRGGSSGAEVLMLAERVGRVVNDRFGLQLEIEPVVYA
jgi:UDP-N-acetylmuramate dehydrogenase